MSDLNSVLLVGRIANDPELKVNGNGTASLVLTLANNRTYLSNSKPVEESNFIRVKVWGKQADNLQKYLGKGKQIGISGRLHQYQFKGNDGNAVYITEVVANQVQFLSKSDKKIVNNIPEESEEIIDEGIPEAAKA